MGYLRTLSYTFTAESDSERILKIGQHLPKLWAIKYRVVVFMKHGVYGIIIIRVAVVTDLVAKPVNRTLVYAESQ